jgi:tRNA-dihydrouridine synthase B
MKNLKIASIELESPVILAPMVDVTDLPYRMICKKAGASLTFTEMTHVEAIIHGGKGVLENLKKGNEERPVGIQITSKTLKGIKEVIPILKKMSFDIVDLNCGCPSHLTIDHGSGAYLLKDAKKIGMMIKILKDSGFTVTAKIRLGFDKNNAVEIAKEIESSGADALTVHARLASQGRSVPADWKEIEKVKKAVKIPVIGNGDVFSGKDAENMLRICDGVMVARGALGNPFIFEQIIYYLRTGKELEFDFNKNIDYFLEYLNLAKKYDMVDIARIKYVGANFIRNIEGAARLRNEFMRLKRYEDIVRFVEELRQDL